MTTQTIHRALISVWNKEGVSDLGRALVASGAELISTRGTAEVLRAAGLPITDLSCVTGFEPLLDGRVKALHPAVFGGLLARPGRDGDHLDLAAQGVVPIDVLVAGLMPFAASQGTPFEDALDLIDIGGPAMIRAAAKNPEHVIVLTDPEDYPPVIRCLTADEPVDATTRRRLAARAFQRTALYDAAIAEWYAARTADPFPDRIAIGAHRREILRYGENPHQRAALYLTDESRPGAATAQQLQGRELSYNNLADADAAWSAVVDFDAPAAVIVKHAAPCALAIAIVGTDKTAFARAHSGDPKSAYGGVVGLNRPIDRATAEQIARVYAEVVIAPDVLDEAREILAGRSRLRVLKTGGMPQRQAPGRSVRSIVGGLLLQHEDATRLTRADLTIVTRRSPSEAEFSDLLFAFQVVKHVKSNGIVVAREGRTIGIGGGQSSRIDAAMLAIAKADQAGTRGAVLASDAFFPFPDSIEAAARAGISAIIQQGGGTREDDIIAAADAAGIAMVVTGRRVFRH